MNDYYLFDELEPSEMYENVWETQTQSISVLQY